MDRWKLTPARDLGLPPSERRRSNLREAGWFDALLHGTWWGLMRAYLRVAHRFEILDRQHLPTEPPFIMVANHSSHLDAIALCAPLPLKLRARVFPLAAGDTFFDKPTTSLFAAHALNALPVWRKSGGRHGMEELRQRLLEEPCGYVLFPEGTRSRNGEMGEFKAGLGMLAAGTNVPVIPCHLEGCFQAWPPFRARPTRGKVRLRLGTPRLHAEVTNDRAGWEQIARETENAVRELGGQKSEIRNPKSEG